MIKRRLATFLIAVCCFSQIAISAEQTQYRNLLCNPKFEFRSAVNSPDEGLSVTCWNTEKWGDISATSGSAKGVPSLNAAGNLVRIKPGNRFWQFATLSELGLNNGDTLSLSVKGFQKQSRALRTSFCFMLIESAEGTWSPADFGLKDKRTFSRHGRGELVRSSLLEAASNSIEKEFFLKLEGLKLDAHIVPGNESSSASRNIVGVLVEFKNVSEQDLWIHSPTLSKGAEASIDLKSSRPIPDYYRQIPRTIQKLIHGEPIHILTLGSSIDRGSANPPLYPYDEDASSAEYKQPLGECRPSKPEEMARFLSENEHRPDLQNYIGWSQHYFMYTGRTRLELMRKFNYPINKILLNVMACDGSSIGESHSGFQEYAELKLSPNPNQNGHPVGKTWNELYPEMCSDGKTPAPDLIIFGHGHNEHIDRPDEIAAYEGAVRWFQKRYPHVEFVSCMWIRDKGSKDSIWEPMRKMCDHYGIPFIDVAQMMIDLSKTCNPYALAPDGGHPGAASHYLWFKQLEKVFELPARIQPDIPQRHLPERMNPYAFGWEGETIRFETATPRLVNSKMMIIEDCTFNIWSSNNKKLTKLLINGQPAVHAGHGRHSWAKPYPRNSSFVHGHLKLGDRHIIELLDDDASLIAVDCKICPGRTFYGADSKKWQGNQTAKPFNSSWGAPYGKKRFQLAAGETIEISVEATDLSIVYLDQPTGGDLVVKVDGKPAFTRATNIPYQDSKGKKHFIENRRGINGLKYQKHRVQLSVQNNEIWILGLFAYDKR